ncbi:putative TRAF3-interacting protein 1-like [Trypanosoma rangeli]|uniref:Putative TRAF3-interacting protein 1-like n=1 Tax=Trypanosoma rangeli TaxID=5698 RepID=A0A422NIC4_TRYRA|nr:putative TRAF3-interacting protein 1-like [Trypanosoma rangeli]RNF05220.1 putative TRAF3-interacting protein 1-like [Trypanosoma rangeli]|eukprot:RNF05220.1 putative TRAF3-interacting protein 1-like [Trypanosoma rangeli]
MGDTEVDFWTPTIEAFQPLQLSGPEITPKLLKRPPFRFIADIVTAINVRFAAYDHIFSPDQLDVTKIDSKEKKIKYLTTLVEYVGSLLGRKIDVSVKKIVSGSEPEKTNVFLKCLALAVGYAQQDKTRKAQTPMPATQEPPRLVTTPKVSTPVTGTPSCSEMPRRIPNSAEKLLKKEAVMREATEFFNKVNDYGYLKLNQEQSIKEVGQSIVDMYNELKHDTSQSETSSLPLDALERAIARQLDVIQQVSALQVENDVVVEKLEVLLSS